MTYTMQVNDEIVNFHARAKAAKAAGQWKGWTTKQVAQQLKEKAAREAQAAKNPDGDVLWM